MEYKCPICGNDGPFEYEDSIGHDGSKCYDYCTCPKCNHYLTFIFTLTEIEVESPEEV